MAAAVPMRVAGAGHLPPPRRYQQPYWGSQRSGHRSPVLCVAGSPSFLLGDSAGLVTSSGPQEAGEGEEQGPDSRQGVEPAGALRTSSRRPRGGRPRWEPGRRAEPPGTGSTISAWETGPHHVGHTGPGTPLLPRALLPLPSISALEERGRERGELQAHSRLMAVLWPGQCWACPLQHGQGSAPCCLTAGHQGDKMLSPCGQNTWKVLVANLPQAGL